MGSVEGSTVLIKVNYFIHTCIGTLTTNVVLSTLELHMCICGDGKCWAQSVG